MGHYDSSYEHDEETARVRFVTKATKLVSKVRKLLNELPSDTPERFLNSLEDLENWLKVNSRN